MKCNNCGHPNRKGVKFCEECGEALQKAVPSKKPVPAACPSCGHKNRAGVKFCEECGANLGAPAAPAPSPPPPPQQVVVQVQEEKKRRLNPLWLLLLLLLLITCCCGLLLTEQVEVPDFAAPIINPLLEDMREAFRGFNGGPEQDGGVGKDGQPKDEGIDCEDFRDQLQKVRRGDMWQDRNPPHTFHININNIGNLKNLELIYQWEGGKKGRANCVDKGNFLECSFPDLGPSLRVEFWIALDECEDELGHKRWEWDNKGILQEVENEFNLTDPAAQSQCCQEIEVTKTDYIQPTVLRLLEVELSCTDGSWGIEDGECMDGETFVGANQDIFWTEVECCLSDDILHCESPHTVDQKLSKTKLELSSENCDYEVFFESPYYGPSGGSECPPGQSMCAGSCCTIGHCCNGGCYESCP